MSEGYRVAVVGATGQVGTLMLQLLREREFPAREIVPFASERSAGRRSRVLASCNRSARRRSKASTWRCSPPADRPRASGRRASSKAGAVVVDNSSHWRMNDDVPLVVAEVNPGALASHQGIVANPNCSTMQMVVALEPLHDAAGIERLVISTYQAVSGTGKKAVDELLDQSHALLHEREIEPPQVYAHQIAFNALPHAGSFAPGDDHTDEERKLINETRKILGDESIRVSATCVRVPVVNGHSEAVNVQTRDDLSPERARELLRAAPGITVADDPDASLYPLATQATGHDEVFVGRIRRDPGHERALGHVDRRRQPAQGRRDECGSAGGVAGSSVLDRAAGGDSCLLGLKPEARSFAEGEVAGLKSRERRTGNTRKFGTSGRWFGTKVKWLGTKRGVSSGPPPEGLSPRRSNLGAMSVSTEVQRTLVKSPPELWSELSNPDALARHLSELGEIRITAVEPETKVEWEAEGASGIVQLKQSGWGTKVTLSVTRAATGRRRRRPSLRRSQSQIAEARGDRRGEPPYARPDSRAEPEPLPSRPSRSPLRARAEGRRQSEPEPVRRRVRADRSRRGGARARPRGARAPTWILCTPFPQTQGEAGRRSSTRAGAGRVRDRGRRLAAPEPIYPERPVEAEPEVVEPAEDLAAELASVEAQMTAETTELLTGVLDRLGAAHHRPFSRG